MLNIQEIAESGELFDGRYKLIRPLSTDGGTADVWLAIDTYTIDSSDSEEADSSDRSADEGVMVAIKIYRPKNALDIDGERRFREEYKIVHNCRHTNLLQPTNYSICNDVPYLELPYCKNGSSETLIGKKLSEKQIWKFVQDVAQGLSYLHAMNPPIIHQDIKPANVLIDDYDNFAITDFGISSYTGGVSNSFYDDGNSGTMAYMSPERFEDNYEPQASSDIWAFGATLYEILTSKVPFGEEGGRSQLENPKNTVTFNKEISKDIQKLIISCLSINPKERPSASEIVKIAKSHIDGKNSIILYLSAALLLILVIFGINLFKGSSTKSLSNNEQYKIAMALLESDTPAGVRSGLHLIDSLAYLNYIPAMYELARTYGWYSDSVSLKRKNMLGIKYYVDGFSLYMPVSNEYNDKARELFKRIIESEDSSYADIKANAAYRLASYYINENSVYKSDFNTAMIYLKKSIAFAKVANDTSLLRKASDGILQLEMYK